ncbi:hypothetical protein QT971_17435 [Microcoleus sp. herbarium19]
MTNNKTIALFFKRAIGFVYLFSTRYQQQATNITSQGFLALLYLIKTLGK